MKALIVTAPFADYAKGEQITDADKIDAALTSNPSQVVVVNLPDAAPAPAPVSKDNAAAPQS